MTPAPMEMPPADEFDLDEPTRPDVLAALSMGDLVFGRDDDAQRGGAL